jgi:hypothetical protein
MDVRTTLVQFATQAHDWVEELCAVLPPSEREAAGTPELWSARDLLVHIAVWKDRLAEALDAALRGERAATYDLDAENEATWRQHQHLTFDEAHQLLAQSQALLIERVMASREEDLNDPARYTWARLPLWKGIVMNSFWHPTLHLAHFWLRRGEPGRLNERVERAAGQLGQMEDSTAWRAKMTYDLACYYALTEQKVSATTALGEALRLDSNLTEWSREDTDLLSLHADPAYEALYGSWPD